MHYKSMFHSITIIINFYNFVINNMQFVFSWNNYFGIIWNSKIPFNSDWLLIKFLTHKEKFMISTYRHDIILKLFENLRVNYLIIAVQLKFIGWRAIFLFFIFFVSIYGTSLKLYILNFRRVSNISKCNLIG